MCSLPGSPPLLGRDASRESGGQSQKACRGPLGPWKQQPEVRPAEKPPRIKSFFFGRGGAVVLDLCHENYGSFPQKSAQLCTYPETYIQGQDPSQILKDRLSSCLVWIWGREGGLLGSAGPAGGLSGPRINACSVTCSPPDTASVSNT